MQGKSGGVAPMIGSNETEGSKLYAITRNNFHEMNEELVLPEWRMLSANVKNAYEKTAEEFRVHCSCILAPRPHRW